MYIKWSRFEGVKSAVFPEADGINEKVLSIPNRSAATEKAYFNFAKSSLVKISRINNYNSVDDITCDDILNWILLIRQSLRASTWRFARASFKHLFEQVYTKLSKFSEEDTDYFLIDQVFEDLKTFEEAIFRIKQFRWGEADANLGKTASQRAKELPTCGSSSREKSVDAEFLFRIDEFIKGSSSQWQTRAIKMCKAILYTGLRPGEWEHASVEDDDKHILITVGSSRSSGRSACGDTRKILVKDVDACAAVRKQIESINSWKQSVNSGQVGSDFSKTFLIPCANALRNAQIQFFGESKGITPYSFRCQFATNLKLIGKSDVEVARILGNDISSLKSGVKPSSPTFRKKSAAAAKKPDNFSNRIMMPDIEFVADSSDTENSA